MTAKKCPLCGEITLVEMRGEFQMELPPTIPGDTIVVPNAVWLHCDSCGEDILSVELEQEINRQCQHRRVSSVS